MVILPESYAYITDQSGGLHVREALEQGSYLFSEAAIELEEAGREMNTERTAWFTAPDGEMEVALQYQAHIPFQTLRYRARSAAGNLIRRAAGENLTLGSAVSGRIIDYTEDDPFRLDFKLRHDPYPLVNGIYRARADVDTDALVANHPVLGQLPEDIQNRTWALAGMAVRQLLLLGIADLNIEQSSAHPAHSRV